MSSHRYEECPKCVAAGRDTSGDNLVVFPDGGKHCFSCHLHIPASFRTFKSNLTDGTPIPKALLPPDFTREIPGTAWKWLLQYGLSWEYWKEAIGFSPSEERLVFRVGDTYVSEGKLVRSGTGIQFSVGRYTPTAETQPKGTELLRQGGKLSLVGITTPRKWYVWGDPHNHCEVVAPNKGKYIVLVEDLISAHKVGQVTTTIPLFGTKYHPPHLYYLLNSSRPVIVWLDNDKHLEAQHIAVRLQTLFNRNVFVINTEADPKELPINIIQEKLNVIRY